MTFTQFQRAGSNSANQGRMGVQRQGRNSQETIGQNSLAVQWLQLPAFTAQSLGSIPGWETKILQVVQCGQKRNNSVAVGQDPGSVSKNTMSLSSSAKLKLPKMEDVNCLMVFSLSVFWILKKMGISDYLTCLLRNLYAGQEATVRTGHEQ